MHLEYGHNHIVTDSPSRKVHNRTVYSWISYCKTSKIQYYKVYKCWVMIANNLSTSPHGLLLLHLVLQHMHGTVPTGWHLLFLLVKLCISGQWMQLEYGHNCQSRVFHQIRYRTGQFIVEFFVAKQALYSTKTWMKQLSSGLHNNFSRAPHGLQFLHLVVQNTHGRVPTVWQLFSCKSVRFCAANALRICTQLPESLCPSSKIQNWPVYL